MTPIAPVGIGPVDSDAILPRMRPGSLPEGEASRPFHLPGPLVPSSRIIIEPIDTMNQLVRMSQIGDAETVKEPSADLRVPFAQSGAFVCKYIIGEPNDRAVCCGAPVADGKSWCAYHRRIVFEPTRPGRIR